MYCCALPIASYLWVGASIWVLSSAHSPPSFLWFSGLWFFFIHVTVQLSRSNFLQKIMMRTDLQIIIWYKPFPSSYLLSCNWLETETIGNIVGPHFGSSQPKIGIQVSGPQITRYQTTFTQSCSKPMSKGRPVKSSPSLSVSSKIKRRPFSSESFWTNKKKRQSSPLVTHPRRALKL